MRTVEALRSLRITMGIVVGLVCALVLAAPARAQFLSPGALSRAHERLDGLSGCTKCHVSGAGLDNKTCLACHTDIGSRIDTSRGYHANVKGQRCNECHKEHRGRSVSLIEWPGGSRDGFNHTLTGFALQGAHAKQKCLDCHEPRRIDDKRIRELIVKEGRQTFLGLNRRCDRCHHDEHRGQSGPDCTKCHTQTEFKPASLFNHDKQSRFPLVGKHRELNCTWCHVTLTDPKPAPVFPERRAATYLKVRDIPHASCGNCHQDIHNGELGTDCGQCHTNSDWKAVAGKVANTAFHDQHAFKLRGQHASVACRSCHGPFPGQPAKYKGLKFARCADCHFDGHTQQIQAEDGVVKCESCHEVTGFKPVRFPQEGHAKTRYPLVDSHRTVACNECHVEDKSLVMAMTTKKKVELRNNGRKLLISMAKFSWPELAPDAPAGASLDCGACHKDVHGGQFQKSASGDGRNAARTCSSCHATTSFADVRFNHDETRFPLKDKHAQATCGDCHARAADAPPDAPIVYRGASSECGSCHTDVHVGQFVDAAGKATTCAGCHSTTSFKSVVFDHNKSAFPLVGKHGEATCAACHPAAQVDGATVVRYKPVPALCTTCHADFHAGAYDSYAPMTSTTGDRCTSCHVATTWQGADFAHDRTRFGLTGKHAAARCASCHGADTSRPQPTSCAGCHADPHQQQFGLQCESCHSTSSFGAPRFAVDAHRASSFPLTGRHAALPCDECHVEKRDRTFGRAAVDCVSCHQKDAAAASLVTVDHRQRPFAGNSCRGCHVPTRFAPAQFAAHDVCFPISRGSHAPVRCGECHAGLAGARFTGNCNSLPFFCTQCHTANAEEGRHAKVPGFEFKDPKCYACHRTAR